MLVANARIGEGRWPRIYARTCLNRQKEHLCVVHYRHA